MLLAIDVGNTQTVLGVFTGEHLTAHWRLATQQDRTADELVILLRNLLAASEIERLKIRRAVLGCVVPALLGSISDACKTIFNAETLVVRPGIRTGIPLLVDNPQEIGADRIANSAGALKRYGSPAIVVDFGTATTFDVITTAGEYAGGLISPGLKISAEALFSRAARLPRIELVRPKALIGRSTIESMRSGIFFGYLAMVDGILDRLLNELNGGEGTIDKKSIDLVNRTDKIGANPPLISSTTVKVVATGGLAGEITPHSRHIQHDDPYLTLYGLKILDEKNPAN